MSVGTDWISTYIKHELKEVEVISIPDLLHNLRRNLQTYREELNLARSQLSKQCGFDSTYVGKIERGSKTPSLKAVMTIADELDVSAHRLFEPVKGL